MIIHFYHHFLHTLVSFSSYIWHYHISFICIEFKKFRFFAFKFTQVNEQLTLWCVTLYRVVKVEIQVAMQEAIQEVVQEVTAF